MIVRIPDKRWAAMLQWLFRYEHAEPTDWAEQEDAARGLAMELSVATRSGEVATEREG